MSTDESPLVSIVIIFLDAGRYIEESIASVMAQDYGRWELLLVDDGSTDDSPDLARAYARAMPDRVRYLQHPGGENRGMSASRNLGIRQAKGTLVALLDADDVWLPHKLSRQVGLLQRHPEAGMVYDATKYWYTWPGGPGVSPDRVERLRRLGFPAGTLVPPPELVPRFLTGQAETPGTCSVLMRRGEIEAVGGFVESFRGMHEDQAFFFKMCLEFPVYLDGGYSALYRQHAGSACAVAARQGLYARALGSNPAEETFLDWLAVEATDRCGSPASAAGRLPPGLRSRLARRDRSARHGASSAWARWMWKLAPGARAARLWRGLVGRAVTIPATASDQPSPGV